MELFDVEEGNAEISLIDNEIIIKCNECSIRIVTDKDDVLYESIGDEYIDYSFEYIFETNHIKQILHCLLIAPSECFKEVFTPKEVFMIKEDRNFKVEKYRNITSELILESFDTSFELFIKTVLTEDVNNYGIVEMQFKLNEHELKKTIVKMLNFYEIEEKDFMKINKGLTKHSLEKINVKKMLVGEKVDPIKYEQILEVFNNFLLNTPLTFNEKNGIKKFLNFVKEIKE